MLTFEIALIAHAIFALSLLEYLAVSLRLDHQPLFGKGAQEECKGKQESDTFERRLHLSNSLLNLLPESLYFTPGKERS